MFMKMGWKLVTILLLFLSVSWILSSTTPPQEQAQIQAWTQAEAQTSKMASQLHVQSAATSTANLIADATVNVTMADTPNNGSSLGVQGQNVGGNCNSSLESYLKVDLSSVSGSINNASLSLRSTFASPGSMTMSLFGSTSDSWDEATVTWNTKPTLDTSTTLASATITAAGSDVVFSSSPALVAFLESQRTADGVATLGIVATACDSASVTQSMDSKEGTLAPQLDLQSAVTPTANLIADATVNVTMADTPNNGSTLGVQGQNVGGSCNSSIESYLKVDLSSFSESINSASLSLRSTFGSPGSMTMSLFGSTSDSWDEATVTWNTKPTLDTSTTLASATITAAGSDVVFSNNPALVAFLESQRTADGVATLGIVATACDSASVTQSIDSKEGTVAPRLDVTGADLPGVDLSPDMTDSGNPGSTVNYTLQVTNTGNVSDTFTLSASGNSWTTNLSPASVSLNGGISTTISAEVMIPADATAGASDTATIVATSALSSTVSDGSNLTTSANAVAGVQISPNMTQMDVVGRTVTYSVQITNTGNANDTFSLTVGNNNWATSLSSQSVGPLTAGESTSITVSVQIPTDAPGGTTDSAMITAISSLDSTANDTTSLSTEAIAGTPGVDLSPDMAKTGTTGTTISYILPVTNTGNVVDTFTVMVAAGNSFRTNLNTSSVGPLDPGQSGIVIASISIPSNAQDETTDMATIVATSMFSSTISDNSHLTTTASVTPQPNVDLSPDMSDSGDPGSTLNYSLQVTNTGNVADTFTLSASGNSWTTNLSAASVTLNAGASTTISAEVQIPAGTLANASDTATIVATSALSSTVSDGSNLTTSANAVAGVEISQDMSDSGDPSSTVNYSLQVTNTGNAADTFTLSVSGQSWTTNLSAASVTLNAGASTTISAEVMIPADATAGASDTATIVATSALSSTVSDGSNLTTSANRLAGVDISPSMTQMDVVGRTVTYTVQITNTGNANDTASLTVGNNNWVVILSSESVGPLTAGESRSITVSVQIPIDASGGTTDSAMITATSSLDSTANDTTSLSTEAIAGTPGVDLSPDMAKTGTTGTTISYILPVTNTGNVVDTFTVVVAAGNNWSTNLNASSVGPLDPGQSGIVIASISIPSNAQDGTTDMATIVATSMFSSTVSDNSHLTTTASVTPQPAVDLSPDMSDSGDPGSTVSYSLQVTNTGNLADTFTLSASGNSWTTNLSAASVTLNAGASTTISAEVMIPANATAGASDTATIVATSALSSTVSDGSNLTTSANAVAGVEISQDMSDSGDPSSTVSYSLQVTNTGNVADTFTLSASGNSWTTNLSAASVTLNAGASTTISAEVMIPADATAGASDTATIVATSALSSTVSDGSNLTTSANRVAGVDISPSMTQMDVVGRTVTYTVQITNTGNANDTASLTVGNNNWVVILSSESVGPLTAGESRSITVSVQIPIDASGGTTDSAMITAISSFDSTANDTTSLSTEAIAGTPGVDLSPDMAKTGTTGTTISYILPVTNTGNVVDTFTITVAAGNNWSTSLNASSVGPLDPGQSGIVIASISIPSNAQDGATDMATIVATSMFSSTISDNSHLTTTASVTPQPAVDLSPDMSDSGDPGSTLNYSLQVTNTGNLADTFTLSASRNSWTTNLSAASVTLNAGASTTIAVSVMIPADTLANASDTATIVATSALSSTVSDGSNLTTSANAVAGVEISQDISDSGDPSSTVSYSLQVTNTGNAADTFTLSAAIPGAESFSV